MESREYKHIYHHCLSPELQSWNRDAVREREEKSRGTHKAKMTHNRKEKVSRKNTEVKQ